ncbi:MAG: hypothetical protein ACJZ1S_03080 [Candidatus Neomarinimicrobiota bacterium]
MRTIDGQYTKNRSFKHRISRDTKLMFHIIKMVFQYVFVGSRIRIIYKLKEWQGKKYWVDEGRYP